MTYEKISEMTAATALAGTEVIEMVQSAATVKVTPAQLKTYVDGTGVTATSVITGEYQFTEDNELDLAGSFADGQASAATALTGLPATTKAILASVTLTDTGTSPSMQFKRSTAGTTTFGIRGLWADGGSNLIQGTHWLPTNGASIYCTEVVADTFIEFKIIGYKTGA